MYSLSLAVSFLTALSQAAEWTLLEQGPWQSREGLMGAYYNNSIWMAGGRFSTDSPKDPNNTLWFNDVWKLDVSCLKDTSTCHWELVTSNAAWVARGYHIMFTHIADSQSYMYVMGGENGTNFFNDVWRSTDGINWELVLDNNKAPFHERAGLAAISNEDDGMIYMSSGCYGSFPNRKTLNDLWRSSDDGVTWTEVITNAQISEMHVRSGPRVQIFNNELYIVAGEHGFSEITQLSDVWKIDLTEINSDASNNEWELVTANAAFANRSGHGFVVDNRGVFWVIAGYYDLHDLWRSEDLGKSWYRVDRQVFNCKLSELRCGRYDFWAQLDANNNLFLYGGDSHWNTFGGLWNQTYQINLDSYRP